MNNQPMNIMGLFTHTFNSLNDLYLNELRDLYSAETQLVEALPKMAQAATAAALKQAFMAHYEETKNQVARLEQIFERLNKKPTGETCVAMKGLIKESEDYIKASGNDSVRDAGLIGAAQRVEHYEIAGYGTTRTLAQRLGDTIAVELLQMTLDEEAAADCKLTEIAESEINERAFAS